VAGHVVFAYDIGCTRRRRSIHRVLRRWRIDGQKSVHECRLDRTEAEELYLQLVESLCPRSDRLLLVWLRGDGPVRRFGKARSGALGLLRMFR